MSQLSDRYYSSGQLKEIAIKNNIPEKYYEDFIRQFEMYVEILTNEGQLGDSELGEGGVRLSIRYIKRLDQEIQKGHGKKWADLYADSDEEHLHAFNDTYVAIKKYDPDLALEELKIHCKFLNGDELYEKRFIYLMENEVVSDPDKQAATYSKIYKEQVALGKSLLFAHNYADWMANDVFNEPFAFGYATAYDKAISNGKPEKYAIVYANNLADYYGENYLTSTEIKHDDIDQFNYDKITGYMKGWEYAVSNKLKNPNEFIELFENEYLNTVYADSGRPKISEEELDKMVLETVLRKLKK
jgi:hypothetical protein